MLLMSVLRTRSRARTYTYTCMCHHVCGTFRHTMLKHRRTTCRRKSTRTRQVALLGLNSLDVASLFLSSCLVSVCMCVRVLSSKHLAALTATPHVDVACPCSQMFACFDCDVACPCFDCLVLIVAWCGVVDVACPCFDCGVVSHALVLIVAWCGVVCGCSLSVNAIIEARAEHVPVPQIAPDLGKIPRKKKPTKGKSASLG